jgi:hypothetical protein
MCGISLGITRYLSALKEWYKRKRNDGLPKKGQTFCALHALFFARWWGMGSSFGVDSAASLQFRIYSYIIVYRNQPPIELEKVT